MSKSENIVKRPLKSQKVINCLKTIMSMLASNVVHLNVALDFNNKNVYSNFFLDNLTNILVFFTKNLPTISFFSYFN